MDIISAHKFSSRHRETILQSKQCGCFYCLKTFSPKEIDEWCDYNDAEIGQTAICPRCGIDSVIGDKDLKFDKEFFSKMKEYWFSPAPKV
jgi:hypothetical protein